MSAATLRPLRAATPRPMQAATLRPIRAATLHPTLRLGQRAPARGAMAAALVAALLLPSGAARAADRITIALFAPSGAFESGEARFAFVTRLAQHVAGRTGLAVEGKAFARAADFEAAQRRGELALAIVDAPYLAQRGAPWPVIATAVSDGAVTSRWVLIAAEAEGVPALAGKRLALSQGGGREAAFVDHLLLEGELPRLFGARQITPDAASAAAAVALRKADAAFVPDAVAGAQRRLFDAGRLPNPALVLLAPSLPAETVEAIRAAVVGAPGGRGYDGWRAGGGEAFRALPARLQPRPRRPVMAEPAPVLLEAGAALAVPAITARAPGLDGLFWSPPGRP